MSAAASDEVVFVEFVVPISERELGRSALGSLPDGHALGFRSSQPRIKVRLGPSLSKFDLWPGLSLSLKAGKGHRMRKLLRGAFRTFRERGRGLSAFDDRTINIAILVINGGRIWRSKGAGRDPHSTEKARMNRTVDSVRATGAEGLHWTSFSARQTKVTFLGNHNLSVIVQVARSLPCSTNDGCQLHD